MFSSKYGPIVKINIYFLGLNFYINVCLQRIGHNNNEPLLAKARVVNFELGGSCQGGGQPLSLLPVQSSPRYPRPICENKGLGVGGAPQSQGTLLGPSGGI